MNERRSKQLMASCDDVGANSLGCETSRYLYNEFKRVRTRLGAHCGTGSSQP